VVRRADFSVDHILLFKLLHVLLLLRRDQTPPRPAVPGLVKVKEPSVDITIASENHIGRGRMNRSRFAGLAAGLCAIALLLGLGGVVDAQSCFFGMPALAGATAGN
jgi:hypothetical protein